MTDSSEASRRRLTLSFRESERRYDAWRATPPDWRDDAAQRQLAVVLELLSSARSLVRTLGVFSANEALGDVKTGDLRLLLIAFYDAELVVQRRAEPSAMPDARIALLERALTGYRDFLTTCDRYALLSPDDRKHWHACDPHASTADDVDDVDDAVRRGGAAAAVAVAASAPRAADPHAQRDLLVYRARREKQLSTEYEELVRRRDAAARSANNNINNNNSNNDDDDDAPTPGVDEELERRITVQRVHMAVVEAIKQVQLTLREADMLKQMRAMTARLGATAPGSAPREQQQQQQQQQPPPRGSLQTTRISSPEDANRLIAQGALPAGLHAVPRPAAASASAAATTAASAPSHAPIVAQPAYAQSQSGGPSRPSSILTADGSVQTTLDRRSAVAGAVFRPHWTQPTMTIEQAIDADIASGAIQLPSSSSSSSSSSRRVRHEDDDRDVDESEVNADNEYDERQVYKDREWDEFTDDNRPGAGNRINQA